MCAFLCMLMEELTERDTPVLYQLFLLCVMFPFSGETGFVLGKTFLLSATAKCLNLD